MTTIAKLTIQMAADVARLKTDMDKAQRTVSGAMGNITNFANKAKVALGAIGAVLAAGAAVKGLTDFINKAAQAADEMGKLSQKTGIAVKDLSGLQLAYKQAGIDGEALEKSMVKLSVAMASGNKAFESMGISVKNADGSLKSQRVVLGELADRFANYQDGAAKAAIAVQIFGKAGADMIPLLNSGSKSLDEYDAIARKLGLTMSEETAKKAEQFNDTIELIGESTSGIGRQILAELLPALNSAASGFLRSLTQGDKLKRVVEGIGFVFKVLINIMQIAIELVTQMFRSINLVFQILKTNTLAFVNAIKLAISGDFTGAFNAVGNGAKDTGKLVVDFAKTTGESWMETGRNVRDVWTGANGEIVAGITATQKAQAPLEEQTKKIAAEKKIMFGHELSIRGAIVAAIQDQQEAEAELAQVQRQNNQAQIDALDQLNRSAQQELDRATEQLEIMRIGEEAYRALELARMNDAIATAEQVVAQGQLNGLTGDALQYAQDYIEKMKEQVVIRRKLNDVDSQKTQIDNQRKVAEGWSRTWDQVAQSMTNALVQGGMRTKDLLRNMFRTLILRPLLDPIMQSIGKVVSGAVTSVFSGGAQAGQSGGSGGILDSFSVVKNSFDTGNAAFEQSVKKFGTWVASFGSQGSTLSNLGGTIANSSAVISKALPYAGSIVKLLQGDVEGAIYTAMGTAVGTAIGGPIGGAIGAYLGPILAKFTVVGKIIGAIFGDSPEMSGNRATGSFAGGKFTAGKITNIGKNLKAGDALQALNQAFSQQFGALLNAFDKDAAFEVNSKFRQRTNIRGSFSLILDGLEKTLIGGKFNSKKAFEKFSKKVMGEGLIKAIQASDLSASIKTAFNNILGETKNADERITATGGLINAIVALQGQSDNLSNTFGIAVDQAIKLADSVTNTTAELIEFTKQLSTIADSAVTVGKRILQAQGALTEALGGTLPVDLAAFDAKMKAINKTTDEGLNQFAQMLKLREGFITFKNALAELRVGVDSAIFSLLTPSEQLIRLQTDMASAFNALNLRVPATVQELIALGESIDYTTETGLNLAAVFPTLVAMFTKTKEATDSLVGSLNQLDINKFTTLANYQRAQAYMSQGMPVTAIPSYDVGTNYVPRDTLAMVHEGEAIIPKRYNQEGGSNMSELVAEVANLRTEVRAVVTHTAKTAKLLDRVTPDGNSLQVVMA